MGVIDIAVDRALDRRIALKTLHGHLRGSDDAVRMFLREARITGLLDHPHIVPVYDIGERDERAALLRDEARRRPDPRRRHPRAAAWPARHRDALRAARRRHQGLRCARLRAQPRRPPLRHQAGERDGRRVRPGLRDGLGHRAARRRRRLARVHARPGCHGRRAPAAASATDNSVIGTPCYMSPEQARGDRAKL